MTRRLFISLPLLDRGVMAVAMDPGFYTGRPYLYIAYTVDPNRNGGMNYNMVRGTQRSHRPQHL